MLEARLFVRTLNIINPFYLNRGYKIKSNFIYIHVIENYVDISKS